MKSINLLRGTSRLFVLVLLATLLAIAPHIGHPGPVAAASLHGPYTFNVNITADTHDVNPGDGVCADSNGLCSLRAAIEEADALSPASTINVPAGLYNLTLGTLPLTAANSITINGTGGIANIRGNNTFGIMSVSSGVTASLYQLTIEHGSAGNGGGIFNLGTLTVTNSSVSFGNTATSGNGGGIFNLGTLTMTNSTVSFNTATNGDGGGIFNGSGMLTVTNSSVFGNTATNSNGGGISNSGTLNNVINNSSVSKNTAKGGGGIYNTGTLYVINNSSVSYNTALHEDGGGIDNDGGTLNVTNSTFSHNRALHLDGGGIDNDGGTLNVTNSTLSYNSAHNVGGGIENEGGGNTMVTSSTLNSNVANRWQIDLFGAGGGIYNTGNGVVNVINSTLSGNTATYRYGGGIANFFGTLNVINSTLSGNTAALGGSGIYNVDTATLMGTIVANGTGSNCFGTITDGGYNLDDVNTCAFTNNPHNNTNPLLGPLANNGGPTQTMALQLGSQAIDWVAGASCPATDQRGTGYPRPNYDGGTNCDIGAYEYQ